MPIPEEYEMAEMEQGVVSCKKLETAHETSTDSWFQAGFVLTTGINSSYLLGYPSAVMVPLGWVGGIIGLILAALLSFYANSLIAKLHEYGGRRNIRYRDLAEVLYGRKAYYITWALQYVNLFMINVGYIILAGSSLKTVYALFRDDHVITLPIFIAMAGISSGLFAICVPHLSALRIWLGFSTLFSLIYIIIGCTMSIKDGMHSPPRDYSIPGTKVSQVFATIGAASNLVFSFNTGMLPEIQATVRPPVVKNMMKGLWFQFTAGLLPMYVIIFAGYWGYGNKVEAYLLNSIHGPIWLKALATIASFLQTIIAIHIFASPMYEYLDTKFNVRGSALAIRNLCFRVCVRGGYMLLTALVSAMLPFLGDFMSLTGAMSTFPLTFILANHMYLAAWKTKLSQWQKAWHWLNVVFFSCLAVAAFVSGLRLIVVDSRTFNLFADV